MQCSPLKLRNESCRLTATCCLRSAVAAHPHSPPRVGCTAQVALNHPASPPSTNSEPRHLKVLHLACTAPYQRPTTNKHCLGTSQRTELCGAAGGGGGEVGSTCIKSKGCTCGATLTERLRTDASALLREPLRTITETFGERRKHWMINLTLLEDYSFF